MKSYSLRIAYIIFFLSLTLSACSENRSGAVNAIQSYLQALVNKDTEQISTLACAAWEADARTELESMTAVTVSLQGLKCQEAGTDGDVTLVSCSGKIVANYSNEVLEIDLSERTYQAVYEAGEWRMCGYR